MGKRGPKGRIVSCRICGTTENITKWSYYCKMCGNKPVKINCAFCGKEVCITFRQLKRKRYCSELCQKKALYSITKEIKQTITGFCSECGKPSNTNKYCSKSCMIESFKKKFRKRPDKYQPCPICGKETTTTKTYCSDACRKIVETNNHKLLTQKLAKVCPVCRRTYFSDNKYCSLSCQLYNSVYGYVATICLSCGKPFAYKPHAARNRTRSYCSRRCAIASGIGRYSEVETITANTLKELKIGFEHDYSIHPFFVDFFIAPNLVLECDPVICRGIYHNHCEHTKEREEKREAYLTSMGYIVIHLDEDTIRNNIYETLIKLKQTYNISENSKTDNLPAKLNVRQAAKVLNIKRQRLLVLCQSGKIKGAYKLNTAYGKPWIIPRESILELKQARQNSIF